MVYNNSFLHQIAETRNRKMDISLYAKERNHILVEMITKNGLWRPGLKYPNKNRWARILVPGTEIDVLVVELTQGYAMITDAIPEVEELLRERTYCATVGKRVVRPYSRDGYFHRHLLERIHGKISIDHEVDHIDRCPLNNTRANLRLVSRSENTRNQGRRSTNTSGYTGISWEERYQRWRVRCEVNGKIRCRSITPSKLGISKEEALELAIQVRKELEEDMGYHDF